MNFPGFSGHAGTLRKFP